MKYFLFVILIYCTSVVQSQEVSTNMFKGHIVDKTTGAPLQGVIIRIDEPGKKERLILTDEEGNFFFDMSDNKPKKIRVEYVGHFTQTVSIASTQRNINIELVQKEGDLNTVEVTALGINKKQRSLTSAQTTLKGSSFTEARTPNVGSALEGQVAGVNVATSSAGPAGSVKILIRGVTSLSPNSSNQPLYVIDGVPFNNLDRTLGSGEGQQFDNGDGIGLINPDDIESITILKGGSAGALYGFRAANGVILITTKQAAKGKTKVSWSNNTSFDILEQDLLPNWQNKYGQGAGDFNTPSPAPWGLVPNANFSFLNWGGSFQKYGGTLQGFPIPQKYGNQMIAAAPYQYYNNNSRFSFYQTGVNETNSINVSSGNDIIKYNLSVTDFQNKGISPTNTLARDNFSINLDITPNKKLEIQILAKYIRERVSKRPLVSAFTSSNPNTFVYQMPNSWDINAFKQSVNIDGSVNLYQGLSYYGYISPYFWVDIAKQNDKTDRIVSNVTSYYHFTPDLYLRGRVTADYYNYNFFSAGNNNPNGAGTETPYRYSTSFDYNQTYNRYAEFNGEWIINYSHQFKSFGVTALLGGNTLIQRSIGYGVSGNVNSIGFVKNLIVDPSTLMSGGSVSNSLTRMNVNSLYTSVDLSYKDYLYLSLTGRNDWYSTLPLNNNSLFYPSVGVSFIPSSLFVLPNYINQLKLRASWAQVGGGGPGPYSLVNTYSNTTPFDVNTPVTNFAGLVNKTLLPYLVTTYEFGVNVQFLKGRLGLDIDYYNKITTNDIVSQSLSNTTGYANVNVNVGRTLNRGVELLFITTPILYRSFKWDISYNFSYSQNLVQQITNPTSVYNGSPYYVNVTITNIKGYAANQLAVYGSPKLDPKTGLPITSGGVPQFSSNIPQYIGTSIQPYQGGITNSFSYKGFKLSFLIDAKFGGVGFSYTNSLATYNGLSQASLQYRETGVLVNGIDQNTGKANTQWISARSYWQQIAGTQGSPYFVYSTDFIKLRQIILGYNVDRKVLQKAFVKGVYVSVVARNIATLLKYTPNIDPEAFSAINGYGVEITALPTTTNIGFNVNLNF